MAQPVSPLTGRPMQPKDEGLGLPWFDKAQAMAQGLLGNDGHGGSVVNNPTAQYPLYRDAGEVAGLLSGSIPLVKGLFGFGSAVAPLIGQMAMANGRGALSVPYRMAQSGGIIAGIGESTVTRLTRDEVKKTAEDVAQRIRDAGFGADVTHSGSAAGASSYVRAHDPETLRYLVRELRVSDHSKGPFQSNLYEHITSNEDVDKVVNASLKSLSEMRDAGASEGMIAMQKREEKALQIRIDSGRKKILKGKPLTASEIEALRSIGEIQ